MCSESFPRTPKRLTRGYGLIEFWLAKQRAKQANALMPSRLRSGSILDIGCGAFPYFLSTTRFADKHGLDQHFTKDFMNEMSSGGIHLHLDSLEPHKPLPFRNEQFEAITILAVVEHLPLLELQNLLHETFRLLRPGGFCIITTPAGWADGVLWVMQTLYLVSKHEIREHKDPIIRHKIQDILISAGFKKQNIKRGSFECHMNKWWTAKK